MKLVFKYIVHEVYGLRNYVCKKKKYFEIVKYIIQQRSCEIRVMGLKKYLKKIKNIWGKNYVLGS